MLAIYRALLRLYPSDFRDEYEREVMAVFYDLEAEMKDSSPLTRFASCAREAGGLLQGAWREHAREKFGSKVSPKFSSRRRTMRSEFRFPKATTTLMTVILVGVVMAIDRGKAIQASVSDANLPVGPIHPAHFTTLPSLLLILAASCAAGAVGWVILFVLHRSGMQRFSDAHPSSPSSNTTLSI